MKGKLILASVSLLFIAVIFSGYMMAASSNANKVASQDEVPADNRLNDGADKLEIYYFHRTQRCSTCLSVGRYTKELIQQKFADKVEQGVIDFREINIDLPENAELVNKFQVGGQSLFINAIKDNQDSISQDINIWRLVRSESQFKSYLENKINGLLAK